MGPISTVAYQIMGLQGFQMRAHTSADDLNPASPSMYYTAKTPMEFGISGHAGLLSQTAGGHRIHFDRFWDPWPQALEGATQPESIV